MTDVRERDVDRGWAWVVLIAASLGLALHESFLICVGIFQVEFLETFSGSQGVVALVCAMALSVQSLLGPVAGMMTDLLGHRLMIMTGGALMSVGMVSASFSPDIYTLLLLFGLVTGLGAGLAYTPSLTVTSNYFDKYRTIANGLTLGAPGVGILAGPYLFRWLIDTYGWRYAMAAYGGLMAQMCVLGAVFYPHQSTDPRNTCCCQSTTKTPPGGGPALKNSRTNKVTSRISLHISDQDETELEVMLSSATESEVKVESKTDFEVERGLREDVEVKVGSRTDLEVKVGPIKELDTMMGYSTKLEANKGSVNKSAVKAESGTDLGVKVKAGSLNEVEAMTGSRLDLEDKSRLSTGLLMRVESGSARQLSEFGSVVLNEAVESLWDKRLESRPLSFRQRVTRLLCHKFMWVMCLNQLLFMSGVSSNTVLFPAFAQSVGVGPQHIPTLFTALGMTIMLVRVAGGFVFSLVPDHLLQVLFGLQLVLAVVLGFLPLYGVSLLALFANIVLVGMTYGPSFLVLYPIIVRYMGLTNLSVAFGLVLLSFGVALVSGPTIAGFMYDIFRSYSVSYYIAGCSVGAGALSLLLLLLFDDLRFPEVRDVK